MTLWVFFSSSALSHSLAFFLTAGFLQPESDRVFKKMEPLSCGSLGEEIKGTWVFRRERRVCVSLEVSEKGGEIWGAGVGGF